MMRVSCTKLAHIVFLCSQASEESPALRFPSHVWRLYQMDRTLKKCTSILAA